MGTEISFEFPVDFRLGTRVELEGKLFDCCHRFALLVRGKTKTAKVSAEDFYNAMNSLEMGPKGFAKLKQAVKGPQFMKLLAAATSREFAQEMLQSLKTTYL